MSGSDGALAPDAPRPRAVAEIAVVLGLPVLLFLGATRWSAVTTGSTSFEISDPALLATLVVEAVLAAALVPWLRRRGWSPDAVAGGPSPLDVLRGAALWLAAMVAMYVAFLPVYWGAPDLATALVAREMLGGISLPVLVLAAVWNSVFEEFLWLGYGVAALESRVGLAWACTISLVLRLSVHAYQGLTGVLIGLFPAMLILTWYFARTRRIWPPIVAHVVMNALAFAPHVHGAD